MFPFPGTASTASEGRGTTSHLASHPGVEKSRGVSGRETRLGCCPATCT